MTDQELNKKIARLIGWKPYPDGGWESKSGWWTSDIPDYLDDPKLVYELLELAVTIGLPQLWQIVDGTWMADIELIGKGEVDVKEAAGPTPSHALARAIVAYKESQP